jgi:TPR repeat protein
MYLNLSIKKLKNLCLKCSLAIPSSSKLRLKTTVATALTGYLLLTHTHIVSAQHYGQVNGSQLDPAFATNKDSVVSKSTLSAKSQHAMQRGDYAEAYCMLRPLANNGDSESEYTLGWMYFNGYGLSVDEARAILWWTKAARQGHADASFAIAMAYLSGEGVEKDESTALQWLLRAAESGQEDAAYIIRSRVALGSKAAKAFIIELIRNDSPILNSRLWVKVARANVRKGPAKGQELLVTLKQGDPLIELNRRGQWLQIGIPGSDTLGWIYSTLVSTNKPGITQP